MRRLLVAFVACLLILLVAPGCREDGIDTVEQGTPTLAPTHEPASEPDFSGSTVLPAGLEHVVTGHNNPDADRINLVFAPWGWDEFDTFRAYVTSLIGWDGHAVATEPDTWPTIESDPGTDLGLFGIEPFRSNRDKFNVWLTTQSPPEPESWLEGDDDPDFIDDQVIVTLARTDDYDSHSRTGLDYPFQDRNNMSRDSTDPFPNTTVAVRSGMAREPFRTIPHELGHAIFGLPDEYLWRYELESEEAVSRWPSCAASKEIAEQWWSHLVGDYDPMVDIYIDELTQAGWEFPLSELDWLRDTNRTAYIESGCDGVAETYRSAEDTLMGLGTSPAFGLTNRLWMEEILELWNGA